MKKLSLILIILILAAAGIFALLLMRNTTAFKATAKTIYIPTGIQSLEDVMAILEKDSVLNNPKLFRILARRMDYPKQIKPGKYEIATGSTILTIIRKLRSGQQVPVNLVINKVRTAGQLAALVAKRFECDSAVFINSMYDPAFMEQHNVDSATVMTLVIPDTYTYFWNSKPSAIWEKIIKRHQGFWNETRLEKAAAKELSSKQVYIIASIVEEETNKNDEKGNVASVYINRIKKSMPLQADPTVKFALQDFTLTRIYQKHLAVPSPYNTYKVKGLPPGPICTPSSTTIDAVLDAPATDYIYFVAKKDFSGYHVFAPDYPTHLKYAREYRLALDTLMLRRQQKADSIAKINEAGVTTKSKADSAESLNNSNP